MGIKESILQAFPDWDWEPSECTDGQRIIVYKKSARIRITFKDPGLNIQFNEMHNKAIAGMAEQLMQHGFKVVGDLYLRSCYIYPTHIDELKLEGSSRRHDLSASKSRVTITAKIETRKEGVFNKGTVPTGVMAAANLPNPVSYVDVVRYEFNIKVRERNGSLHCADKPYITTLESALQIANHEIARVGALDKSNLPEPNIFSTVGYKIGRQSGCGLVTTTSTNQIKFAMVHGIFALNADSTFSPDAANPNQDDVWVILTGSTFLGYSYRVAVNGDKWYELTGNRHFRISADKKSELLLNICDKHLFEIAIKEFINDK